MSGAPATATAGEGGMLLGGAGGGGRPEEEPCSGTALEIRKLDIIDTDGDELYERGERIRVVAELASVGKPTRAKLSLVADDPALEQVGGSATAAVDLVPEQPSSFAVDFLIPLQVERGSEYAFMLTLTSSQQPACFASVTREQLLTVRDEPQDLRRCEMVRQLELSNPYVVDDSGDGQVQPGENFELRLTLTNPGPLDEWGYPGMTVASTDPGIGVVDELAGWYFAIGIASINQSWGMWAQSNVKSGTQARLTLTPALQGLRCRNVTRTLEYSLRIE